MSGNEQEAGQPSPPEPSQEPETMSLAEFLESVPPSQIKEIKSLVYRRLQRLCVLFSLNPRD
jgi:hypothetical protein